MNNLVIIGHPDKKSFCHNGIFSTITKILSQHQNQNTKTIDLYEDKLHEGKKQLIESYKKKVLWAERIYFISPIWWFRLTPKMETFFSTTSKWARLAFKLKPNKFLGGNTSKNSKIKHHDNIQDFRHVETKCVWGGYLSHSPRRR